MLRLLLAFIISCTFALQSKAQNLVPNPSFEEYTGCPALGSDLHLAKDWVININTPDYYNVCATFSISSVPDNVFGFQYPATGDAYAGFYGKVKVNQEAREYIGAKLSSPLIVGERYYVSFQISLNTKNCYINKIGMLFTNYGDTTSPYAIIPPELLIKNFAHLYTDSLITDTLHWTKIAGSFIADSTYQYFMIGNFFDDSHIDSVLINDSNCSAYYYLDNVCVSNNPSECGMFTSNNNVEKQSISIYPNPASQFVNVLFPDYFSNMDIYDVFGNIKFHSSSYSKITTVDISEFANGIYFLRVRIENNTLKTKFLIQK